MALSYTCVGEVATNHNLTAPGSNYNCTVFLALQLTPHHVTPPPHTLTYPFTFESTYRRSDSEVIVAVCAFPRLRLLLDMTGAAGSARDGLLCSSTAAPSSAAAAIRWRISDRADGFCACEATLLFDGAPRDCTAVVCTTSFFFLDPQALLLLLLAAARFTPAVAAFLSAALATRAPL